MIAATRSQRHSFAAILAALIGLLAAPVAAADKVVLQLRWHHDFQFAGYYAALWQGYYSEAGLDVEIRDSFSKDGRYLRSAAEVAAGRAQFGIAGSDLIPSQDKGVAFTVVAPIFQESPLTIYAKEGTRLASPADLKRLNLGMFMRGNVSDAEIQTMLKIVGLDPQEDLPRVTVTRRRLADIIEGRIDAAVTYTTDLKWLEKELGAATVQLKPSSFGVDFYGDSLFTRREFAARAPHVVKAFREASLKGWRYALTHGEEVADRIAGELMDRRPMDDPVAFIRSQIEAVTRLTHYPVVALGSNDLARWRRIHAALAATGMVAGDPPSSDFVYDPAREERQRRQTLWVGVGMAALLVVSLSILAWIVSLRRGVAARTRALAYSEERFALAPAGTNDGIWDFEFGTGSVHRSPRLFEILGYDEREFRPGLDDFPDFIHPDDRDGRERAFAAHLEQRIPYDHEFRLRHKSGDYVWVRATGQATWDEDGRPRRMAGSLSDISDLKKADIELRESEALYRELMENAPFAVIVTRRDGIMEFANQTAVEMFRADSVGDFVGEDNLVLLHPDFHQSAKSRRGRILHGRRQPFVERLRIRFDGTEFMSESNGSYCTWGGEPAVLIAIRDISDRIEAEEHLRESEERYALAIAGMNDGIWERNFQTGKVHRSPRFYRILGYEPEDLEPDTEAFYDLLPPGDQERCLDALRTHLETGAPFDVEGEYRIRHKSGEYIWISVNAQAEWDESGEPIRMAGSISDITERKRHQRALRTSEERFRAVIDNSPTAIFLQGLDGRFQFVNRQFRTWYGLSEDEVVGKTSDEFFPEAFAEDSKSLDREVLRAGKPLDREFRAPFIDGGEHTIIATKFPVRGSDGEIIGVGTISTDVTDQRQAEETLRHAQKMEAVGLLTGGIAHEFNNLLMIVVGNLEMLQDRLAKGDRSNDFASSAMKGALRGAELTQSLLAFSRKQTLAIVPIDLNDLIRGLRDMLGRTLGETITLDMRLAGNLPKTLADSGQIEGALLNFVLNARDAMPGGGTITVGTSTRSLDTGSAAKFDARPGDYVSLEVTDTGHGMTAETIEQAFEPFFTTKNVGEGTGLGLSMVYGFAKQSNGFVELVSKAGRGTTVRLCLPRAETHGEERITVAEDQEREEAASDRAMILVVEDDPDVRALVVRMLAGMGHDTVQAEDGRSALARLAEHPGIDLLFTDVVLPDGMSGQDIAREAKRRFPALKIVFTSGYPAGNFGDLSLNGEDPIIVAKPYRNSELAKTLTSALRA